MSAKQQPAFDFAEEVQALITLQASIPGQPEDYLIKSIVSADSDFEALRDYQIVSVQRSVLAVLRAGYSLLALKAKFTHGRWEEYAKVHLQMSKATICRYMAAAKSHPDPSKILPSMTVTELFRGASREKNNHHVGLGEDAALLRRLPGRLAAAEKSVNVLTTTPDLDGIPEAHRKSLAQQISSLITTLTEARSRLASGSEIRSAVPPLAHSKALPATISHVGAAPLPTGCPLKAPPLPR